MGHSLVDGEDHYSDVDEPLDWLLATIVQSAGYTYEHYRHTTPGAPIGWNWGGVPDAWTNNAQYKLPPLIDESHPDYGTFDTMVVTEGVAIASSYDWWTPGAYARKFYCAAFIARPDVELFLYESWHHLQASDPDFTSYYGPYEDYDFEQYQRDARAVWNTIADEAADPSLTPDVPPDHGWWGPGEDPGVCDEVLDVKIVPTGQALVHLLERLAEDRPGDDWSYAEAAVGGQMSRLDLFNNPWTNWPADTVTTVHNGVHDDIHPSHLLVYLNAAVHYATVYRRDPRTLSAANGVPENLASILLEVAYETVTQDPRTGYTGN